MKLFRKAEPEQQFQGPIGYWFDPEKMVWRHAEAEEAERVRIANLERQLEMERQEREAPSMDGFERRPRDFTAQVANLPEPPSNV